jgi:hypothetical protein
MYMQFDILEIQIHAFLFAAVGGGLHAPAALPPEKETPVSITYEAHKPQSLSVGSGKEQISSSAQ